MTEEQEAGQLVRDLVPLLHCLRARLHRHQDHDQDQDQDQDHDHDQDQGEVQGEWEVQGVARLLRLPSSELERVLAEEGFCFDELQLVARTRQLTLEALQATSSSGSGSSSSSSSGSVSVSVEQLQSELGLGSSGNACTHSRVLDALRLQISSEVAANTHALPADSLLLATNPSSQALKKCKLEWYVLYWTTHTHTHTHTRTRTHLQSCMHTVCLYVVLHLVEMFVNSVHFVCCSQEEWSIRRRWWVFFI